jgi:hypothetical protein
MGKGAQSPATAFRRSHSACAGGGWRAEEPLWSQHRSTRSQSSDAVIGCTLSPRVRRRDASLPTSAARGSAVVVRRVCGLHGRISGSVRRRGAPTPGEPFARTPRDSRGSRSRIVRRCTPASGNADSCRAGMSQAPRAAPSPPPRWHWTAPGRRGITGLQSRLPRRCAPRARGSTPIKLPGPSSICSLHREHSRSR